MPFISITRLRVRSWTFLPAFFIGMLQVTLQVARADGNLAVRLLRDERNTFWTGTSWSSMDNMKAFMLAKPHGPVMHRLLDWCDEAAVVHWTQTGPELPEWDEAHKRMQQEGRPSKVNHPSAEHVVFVIKTPAGGRGRDLRLKG
jgi:hypothetical protein